MVVYDISNSFKDTTSDWKIGRNYYWIIAKPEELEDMAMDLDEECLIECKNLKQSSKISFFDGYIFMVINILEYDNEEIISKELNVFLGKDYIITVHKDHCEIINALLKDIQDNKNCFILKDNAKPSVLLYYILDRVIIRNYNVISDLEAQADKIEIDILKNANNNQAHKLITLRRQVYKIRKYLNPLRYIGDSLILNENNIIQEDNIKYFKNLNNKITKLMLSLENLVQDLALVREAFESEIANKTNELMKVFTLVATIFLPLELLTGIFGMSFDYMPLKGRWYGSYFICFIMALIVLYLLKLFKKNQWL